MLAPYRRHSMEQLNQSSPFNIKTFISPFILKSRLKKSSRNTYTSRLLNFAAWLRQNKIQCPTEHDIHIFLSYLKLSRQLTTSSSNGYITTLKMFFAWLNTEHIYSDITHSLKGYQKITGKKKRTLSSLQIKKIFRSINCKTLDGKRDLALINVMLFTSLRSIEIPDIIRGDIATCCGLHILWVKSKNGTGKNKDSVIPDDIFSSIIAYLDARGSINDSDPLIASHSRKNFGQRLTSRSVSRLIGNIFHSAHIDTCNITPSSLRHTAFQPAAMHTSKHKHLNNT